MVKWRADPCWACIPELSCLRGEVALGYLYIPLLSDRGVLILGNMNFLVLLTCHQCRQSGPCFKQRPPCALLQANGCRHWLLGIWQAGSQSGPCVTETTTSLCVHSVVAERCSFPPGPHGLWESSETFLTKHFMTVRVTQMLVGMLLFLKDLDKFTQVNSC